MYEIYLPIVQVNVDIFLLLFLSLLSVLMAFYESLANIASPISSVYIDSISSPEKLNYPFNLSNKLITFD